jgi:hypothetical protein
LSRLRFRAESLAQWDQRAAAIRVMAEDVAAGKYATLGELQKALGAFMR